MSSGNGLRARDAQFDVAAVGAQSATTLAPSAFVLNGHQPQALYPYTDQEGRLVAVIARFAPGTLDPKRKSFRPFRLLDGRWQVGLDGQALPPYRVAELLSRNPLPERVFVVEGEKCVDALRGAGLCATTNAFGAEKWTAEHAKYLRGLHVVVVEDNDAPGRRHAQAVATSLVGVAAGVSVVATPGAAERRPDDGWDVADWLGAGGSADLLTEIAASAPPFQPEVRTDADWPEPVSLGDCEESVPFPLTTALPPRLAELVSAVAETVMVDVTAPAVLVPAVLSIACGNAFSVKVSNAHTEPNLSRYMLWSKPSGERGSQLFRVIADPLDAWMGARHAEYLKEFEAAQSEATFLRKRAEKVEQRAASETDPAKVERLRHEAADARSRIPRPPRRPMLYIGDTTAEALVRAMAVQGGSLGMLSADARQTVDGLLGRYRSDGKTDDSVLLRAHGGDVIDRGRVGNTPEGEYLLVSRPQIGLALAIQPDKMDELGRRPELLASGFLPRCNAIAPASRVGTRIETGDERPIAPELIERWHRAVRGLADERFRLVGKDPASDWRPVRLELDDQAKAKRRAFANELERRQAPDGDLSRIPAFASKAAGEAARLAALLFLAELAMDGELAEAGTTLIPAEVWNFAEAHQRWQLAESLRVFSLARERQSVRLARRTLMWVARRPQDRRRIQARDLIEGHLVTDTSGATELMDVLAEFGWARVVQGGKPRAKPTWEFHPSLFGGAS